jgi:hypothetical protein
MEQVPDDHVRGRTGAWPANNHAACGDEIGASSREY